MFHKLQLPLLLISTVAVHQILSSVPLVNNTQDETALESRSDKLFCILPLIIMKYFDTYKPPVKIQQHDWAIGENFFTAETVFEGATPAHQVFFCDLENFQSTEDDDKYCSYPIKFKEEDVLKCNKEPEPFARKYIIAQWPDPLETKCGRKKAGKLYEFVYKTCMTETLIENEKTMPNKFLDPSLIKIEKRSLLDIYRFCYDEITQQVLYTRHDLKLLDLLSDVRLEHEQEKIYPMITSGYESFSSQFENVKEQYIQLEEQGYKAQKLAPSDHFPFALWGKATYHYLNTMPMREELVELWDRISKRIKQNGIQTGRKYVVYTGTFIIKRGRIRSAKKGEIQVPDIWIRLLQGAEEEGEEPNREISYSALSIILNNNFNNDKTSSTKEFIAQKFCEKSSCENAFSKSFPETGNYIHCCAAKESIFELFEEGFVTGRVLETDFLFDNVGDNPTARVLEKTETKKNQPSLTSNLSRITSKLPLPTSLFQST